MINPEYTQIPCLFYDILEALATKSQLITILFKEEGEEKNIKGIISTFQIEKKVEYLVLKSGEKIRLDALVEVDGNKLSNYNYC